MLNNFAKYKSLLDYGEMAEWFKAHAWKVCVLLQVPWVRIPLSPPVLQRSDDILQIIW